MRLFAVSLILSVFILSANSYAQQSDDQIKSIFFGGGSYFIDDEQINEIKEFLESHPNIDEYNIIIHSHTDNIGSVEYNQWLSRMRSESVLHQLILNNIPMNHIRITDFGEKSPVFNNDSWEGRIRNRRVDIIIEPLTL